MSFLTQWFRFEVKSVPKPGAEWVELDLWRSRPRAGKSTEYGQYHLVRGVEMGLGSHRAAREPQFESARARAPESDGSGPDPSCPRVRGEGSRT